MPLKGVFLLFLSGRICWKEIHEMARIFPLSSLKTFHIKSSNMQPLIIYI